MLHAYDINFMMNDQKDTQRACLPITLESYLMLSV